MVAVLMTWNPARYPQFGDNWDDELAATEAGGLTEGQWSVGNRRSIPLGQRAYLLRQGPEPRGIIASGWTTTEVFEEEHYDDPSRQAHYVEVVWDQLTPLDDPLPTADLLAKVPEVSWNNLMRSGVDAPDSAVITIDELWNAHLRRTARMHRPDRLASRPQRTDGQGFEALGEARMSVENYAQELVEEHFRQDGWEVEDTRIGHPYDAVARRDGEIRYLEAKGTQGNGQKVMVTAGEVQFAIDHPGRCVMGVVSQIALGADGEVVAGSGLLEVFDWNPDEGDLFPVTLRWTPPRHAVSDEATPEIDAS
ncbi:uncharacterized protein DUF3883 [Isoptericola sp. CG 20/1183]|uniref:Uncharacterized protein DUF3883 n=1 Tax=Isoptericola halotolerans TaxID=300560 RepID=A0ABX5EKE4_9MICO|nr:MULTISPECIES: DUF3883 domain-containing protein [Isoptericola]PRZ08601.1 uncharacterized protein DUF3883 [Isoptericola halotolerans]PRZ10952.1 uncharacterized protein DUF3883 [Isoptericola sp. CG 20/1183]